MLNNKLIKEIEEKVKKLPDIETKLSNPSANSSADLKTLAKEHSEISTLREIYESYKDYLKKIEETDQLLNETEDVELIDLAKDEKEDLNYKFQETVSKLKFHLIPPDPRDEKNIILEVRSGTGGLEAALFAADLFKAYLRYCQLEGWKTEILNSNVSELGGVKEIIAEIKGKKVFSKLKFESGVHRVQRIPQTETAGRIHTSTATVAILPVADHVEVKIEPTDIRIDIFHASGAGGQHVNKVATAVRITHLPTSITVVCQDERSQFRNRQKAENILRARLLQQEEEKAEKASVETRRLQVGSGERSEKIRTYNFPQDRITDNRIKKNYNGIERVLQGEIDQIINDLIVAQASEIFGD